MNINLTLIVQMLVFIVLIWFTMKFVWPMILGPMEERSRKIAVDYPVALVNSVNADRLEGQKSAAFEEARGRGQALEGRGQPGFQRRRDVGDRSRFHGS